MDWRLTTGTRSTPKHLAGNGGPVAQNSAQRCAVADFLDQLDGSLGVTEFGQPGFHGHADGGAHFDGVQTEIVIHAVQQGNGIQIVDAAVAAVGPDRLVFGLFGDEVAVFVVKGARAADHAAPVAAVGG
jgi:hypothetical protein